MLLAPLALCLVLPAQAEPPPPQFRFCADVFGPGPYFWTEGVVLCDVDQDADLDVFFARGEGWNEPGAKHPNALFINRREDEPWRFVDESRERLGLNESHARDVLPADVDGDGWMDALFCNGFNRAPPFLYVNQGAARPGHFRMESDARGLTEALSSATGAFGDVDRDGDLDLVISDTGPDWAGPPGGTPRLYENDGRGFFVERADLLPAPVKVTHMGVNLVDLDEDFDLDFFGANKTGNHGLGHYLMLNDGSGRFDDRSEVIPKTTGMVYEADNADLDGDGDMDFFFISLAETEAPQGTRFPLGEGPMESLWAQVGQVELEARVALGQDDDNDLAFLDHDLDGDLDVLVASLGPREKLLRNDGAMHFTLDHAVFEAHADPTLDLAIGDLDGDGDCDVVTANGLERIGAEQPPCGVYENTGPPDRLAPRITAVEALPARVPRSGPWIVHAKAVDQVLQDGRAWITAEAWYQVLPEPQRVEVLLTPGGFQPPELDVPAGSVLSVANDTNAPLRLTCAEEAFDSGSLDAGESANLPLLREGARTVVAGSATLAIRVTGSAHRVAGTFSGGSTWRFRLDPPAADATAAELLFQLRFTDHAGNEAVTPPALHIVER